MPAIFDFTDGICCHRCGQLWQYFHLPDKSLVIRRRYVMIHQNNAGSRLVIVISKESNYFFNTPEYNGDQELDDAFDHRASLPGPGVESNCLKVSFTCFFAESIFCLIDILSVSRFWNRSTILWIASSRFTDRASTTIVSQPDAFEYTMELLAVGYRRSGHAL